MRTALMICVASMAGCRPVADAQPSPALDATEAPAAGAGPKIGQEIDLTSPAYFFRDEVKIADYARLMKIDRGVGHKFFDTGLHYEPREDFDNRPDPARNEPVSPSDMVLLHTGSKVLVVNVLPDDVLKVMIQRALTNQVDEQGKSFVGENADANYTGEVGYLVLGLVKMK